MTTNDDWNRDQAWAEQRPEPVTQQWSDAGEPDWAEDLRSGAAYHMQGYSPSTQQSGLGIASLVLSIVAGLMIGIPLVFAVAMVAQNPNVAEDDPLAIGLGCAMLVGLALAVVAGLLGVIALFQPDRSKTCAALGLLFAGIQVFGILGLFVLGLMVG